VAAQRLGFSLDEIADLLDVRPHRHARRSRSCLCRAAEYCLNAALCARRSLEHAASRPSANRSGISVYAIPMASALPMTIDHPECIDADSCPRPCCQAVAAQALSPPGWCGKGANRESFPMWIPTWCAVPGRGLPEQGSDAAGAIEKGRKSFAAEGSARGDAIDVESQPSAGRRTGGSLAQVGIGNDAVARIRADHCFHLGGGRHLSGSAPTQRARRSFSAGPGRSRRTLMADSRRRIGSATRAGLPSANARYVSW
jgi:hypothetical protein